MNHKLDFRLLAVPWPTQPAEMPLRPDNIAATCCVAAAEASASRVSNCLSA